MLSRLSRPPRLHGDRIRAAIGWSRPTAAGRRSSATARALVATACGCVATAAARRSRGPLRGYRCGRTSSRQRLRLRPCVRVLPGVAAAGANTKKGEMCRHHDAVCAVADMRCVCRHRRPGAIVQQQWSLDIKPHNIALKKYRGGKAPRFRLDSLESAFVVVPAFAIFLF